VIKLPVVRQRLIHLYHCRGMTRRFIHKLLIKDPQLQHLYTYSAKDLHNLLLLPLKNAEQFLADLHNDRLLTRMHQVLKPYELMTIFDRDYPFLLKAINDPPLVLFLAGQRQYLQNNPRLSVIGTRNPSRDAAHKVAFYLKPLIKEGWTIVSGLARGVDSFAHQVTVQEGGVTIAVLGSGFQHIYPKEHVTLFKNIVQTGLVITEYPPHIVAQKHHFPERNRLISGLSYGTLVIEAMERSGTLITVDQALDQGRQVYVAPGSPLIKQTHGCLRMIQDGAQLVVNADDLRFDWETVGKHLLAK